MVFRQENGSDKPVSAKFTVIVIESYYSGLLNQVVQYSWVLTA